MGLDKNFLERRRAIEKNKAPATATADHYGMPKKHATTTAAATAEVASYILARRG